MPAARKLAPPPFALRAPAPPLPLVHKHGKRGKRGGKRGGKTHRGGGRHKRRRSRISSQTSEPELCDTCVETVEPTLSARLRALLALVDL